MIPKRSRDPNQLAKATIDIATGQMDEMPPLSFHIAKERGQGRRESRRPADTRAARKPLEAKERRMTRLPFLRPRPTLPSPS
jgi:hypothetical protein